MSNYQMTRPRILLAEDHTIVRAGLVSLLSEEFEVVGDVGDGHSLVRTVERLRPDVLVLDIQMPLLNGIECSAQVRSIAPEAHFLDAIFWEGVCTGGIPSGSICLRFKECCGLRADHGHSICSPWTVLYLL